MVANIILIVKKVGMSKRIAQSPISIVVQSWNSNPCLSDNKLMLFPLPQKLLDCFLWYNSEI